MFFYIKNDHQINKKLRLVTGLKKNDLNFRKIHFFGIGINISIRFSERCIKPAFFGKNKNMVLARYNDRAIYCWKNMKKKEVSRWKRENNMNLWREI